MYIMIMINETYSFHNCYEMTVTNERKDGALHKTYMFFDKNRELIDFVPHRKGMKVSVVSEHRMNQILSAISPDRED